jgi:hypothetical protein
VFAFARAFSLAQPLFSVIDVGQGKERADHKIRETLRVFLPNAQCKHMYFGPANDNGYLCVLESYKREYVNRLTLVETRPAEPGFVESGLRRIQFPKIFRADNLPSRPTNSYSSSSIATMPALTPQRSASGSQMAPNVAPFIPKPASPAPSSDSASSNTWATVGKGVKTNGNTINIAPKKLAQRRHILLNAYDQRIDIELPRKDATAEKRFNEALKTGKYCNNYHLTGDCKSTPINYAIFQRQ